MAINVKKAVGFESLGGKSQRYRLPTGEEVSRRQADKIAKLYASEHGVLSSGGKRYSQEYYKLRRIFADSNGITIEKAQKDTRFTQSMGQIFEPYSKYSIGSEKRKSIFQRRRKAYRDYVASYDNNGIMDVTNYRSVVSPKSGG